MKYYLVDKENVESTGLQGIEHAAKGDTVDIFYTNAVSSLPMKTVESIVNAKCHVVLSHVANGTPNALDFQLVTKLMHMDKGSNEYIIISKDKGYDCAVSYAEQFGLKNIRRAATINDAIQSEAPKMMPDDLLGMIDVPQGRKKPSDDELKYIIKTGINAKTKQAFYQSIVQKYGMEHGLDLYHMVKPQYNAIKACA